MHHVDEASSEDKLGDGIVLPPDIIQGIALRKHQVPNHIETQDPDVLL